MYHVEITPDADSGFKAKSANYEFSISVKGKGITPPDTLLAGLGSCIGVYLRRYLEGANLSAKNFSVTVEAEFSKEPPACFRNIDVRIDLKGLKLDERRKKALLEFIENCPVHNTFKISPKVNFSFR